MSFDLFVGEAWMIPAVADFLQRPVEEIHNAWDESIKKKTVCVIRVPGDIPPYKNCPICGVMARQELKVCAIPTCEYAWKE